MLIAHYYRLEAFRLPQKVLLESDDIELARLFLKDGTPVKEIMYMFQEGGYSFNLIAMILSAATFGVKTFQDVLMEKEC